jgi:hypothetical protein
MLSSLHESNSVSYTVRRFAVQEGYIPYVTLALWGPAKPSEQIDVVLGSP